MSTMFIIIFIYTFASRFDCSEANAAYYCDSELCSEPEKYCCGPNECCNYVWTVWYLWLAIGAGLLIAGFLAWKYYVQKNKPNKSSLENKQRSQLKSSIKSNNGLKSSSQASLHQAANNQSFSYMPLTNDDIFIENQIDENTIQFNLVPSARNDNLFNKSYMKTF